MLALVCFSLLNLDLLAIAAVIGLWLVSAFICLHQLKTQRRINSLSVASGTMLLGFSDGTSVSVRRVGQAWVSRHAIIMRLRCIGLSSQKSLDLILPSDAMSEEQHSRLRMYLLND